MSPFMLLCTTTLGAEWHFIHSSLGLVYALYMGYFHLRCNLILGFLLPSSMWSLAPHQHFLRFQSWHNWWLACWTLRRLRIMWIGRSMCSVLHSLDPCAPWHHINIFEVLKCVPKLAIFSLDFEKANKDHVNWDFLEDFHLLWFPGFGLVSDLWAVRWLLEGTQTIHYFSGVSSFVLLPYVLAYSCRGSMLRTLPSI